MLTSATSQISSVGEFSSSAVPRALITLDATPLDLLATQAFSKFYDPADVDNNLVQATWTATGITHQVGSDTATGPTSGDGERLVYDNVTGVFIRVRLKFPDSTANGSVEITTTSLGLENIDQSYTGDMDRAWVLPGGSATVENTTAYTVQFTHPSAPGGMALTGEADTEVLTAAGSAFANDDIVVITALTGGTGLSSNTAYYVINVSGTSFQVANTAGGSAVAFSADVTATSTINPSNVTGEADTDIFTVTGLSLSNGEAVVIVGPAGGTGLTGGNTYYVINLQADGTFQLSATEDGDAIDITTDLTGGVLRQKYANLTVAIHVYGT